MSKRRASKTTSWVGAAAALGLITLVTDGASADALEDECAAIDRTRQTSCQVERPRGQEWLLATGYQVGTGRKAGIEVIEARFCEAARRAGVAGRVLRSSEIPGVLGNGATIEFQCGLPAVSTAPRHAR